MPIEFRTCLDLDLVYARWWGIVDADVFLDNFARYLADRHYRPGRPELIDVSGIERFDLDFARIRTLLLDVNLQVPGTVVDTRTVIWAPEDAAFGLARMYQQLAEHAAGIQVEIYREEAAALAAYDLPHRTMDALLAAQTWLPPEPR